MNEKIRELLYRSLDENLPETEARRLAQALQESSALREEHAHMLRVREALGAEVTEGFSRGFVMRVMERIEASAAVEDARVVFAGALVRLFRPVAAVATAAVLLLAGWNVVATGEVVPPDDEGAYVETDTAVLQTPVDALFEETS